MQIFVEHVVDNGLLCYQVGAHAEDVGHKDPPLSVLHEVDMGTWMHICNMHTHTMNTDAVDAICRNGED
eukprot:69991-Prorocentrum_lima.AAC.1